MAWVNLGTVGWGTSPTINCNLQYDRRRSGSAMEYNAWIEVNTDQRSLYFGYPIYLEISMDGTVVHTATLKGSSPSHWSNAIAEYSGWKSIANKTSGTTSLKYRLYSGSGSTRDTSWTYSMAVDPAGSDITASNGTLGTAQTITLTKYVNTFTDTLTWSCGSQSGVIATDSLLTSFSWTPPLSLASENTEGTSVSVTLTTETKQSGVTVQTKNVTITCDIPASVKPSATVAISDANGYESTYGDYVQSKSALTITVTPTLAYNSAINSYSISADGNLYGATPTTTPVLQNSGAQNVTATVTDKRGRTSNPATQAYNVLAYAQPYLTNCVIQRSDNLGNADEEGHYMCIDFTGVITALNNVNSAVWAIRYRVVGTPAWTDYPLPGLTGNYTPAHQEVIAAADANAFEVEVRATDDFGTITVGTGTIPIAFTIMNWRTNGDGMAIGGINTKAGLQIYMDTEFTGDADFSGDLTAVDVDITGDFKQNGASIFPVSIANGGTGATTETAAIRNLLPGVYEYTTSTTNPLTTAAQSVEQKSYTAQNDGLVFLSGSMRVSGGTYGSTVVAIEKNNTVIAYANDRLLSAWTGDVATHAAAMVKVTAGDVLEISQTSTRYTSGNTATRYYNVIAIGTALTVT